MKKKSKKKKKVKPNLDIYTVKRLLNGYTLSYYGYNWDTGEPEKLNYVFQGSDTECPHGHILDLLRALSEELCDTSQPETGKYGQHNASISCNLGYKLDHEQDKGCDNRDECYRCYDRDHPIVPINKFTLLKQRLLKLFKRT